MAGGNQFHDGNTVVPVNRCDGSALGDALMTEEATRGYLAEGERPAWLSYPDSFTLAVTAIQSCHEFSSWWVPSQQGLSDWMPALRQVCPDRDLIPFAEKQGADIVACFERGRGETVILIDLDAPGDMRQAGTVESVLELAQSVEKEACETINQLVSEIRRDARIQKGLSWGDPRPGHDEGTIGAHVAALERNLAAVASFLSPYQRAVLELMILTHDTFKGEATPKVPINDPRSHASLAVQYLGELGEFPAVAAMLQWHDMPYSMWKKFAGKEVDERLVGEFVARIPDWDTFLAFVLIDNLTPGKDRTPTQWALDTFGPIVKRSLDHDEMMRILEAQEKSGPSPAA